MKPTERHFDAVDLPLQVDQTSAANQAQHQLEAVCNNASVALFIMNEHQHCIYMNPAAIKLTGYSLSEVADRPLHDVIHHTRPDGSHYPLCECPIDRAFPENNQEQGEDVFVHKSGRFYHVAYTASPICEGTQIVGTVIEVQDITQRKLSEAAARQDQERFRVALEAANVVAWDYDLTQGAIYTSDTVYQVLGMLPESRVADPDYWHRHIAPEDRKRHAQIMAQVMNSDKSYISQFRWQRPDNGKQIWVESKGRLYRHPDRGTQLISGVLTDITDRVRTEAALKESEERLQLVIDGSNDGIWDWDFHTDRAWWNKRMTEIMGIDIPEGERSLSALNRFAHPDDMDLIPNALEAQMERDTPFEVEFRFLPPSRELKHLVARGKLVRDSYGRPIRLAGTLRDITARKQAELALMESESQFRQIANGLPQIVWVTRPDGRHEWFNSRWYEYTGYDPEAGLELDHTRCIHPQDLAMMLGAWRKSLRSGKPYNSQYRCLRHDGEWRWFLSRAVALRDTDGRIVRWFGTCTDIQDHKESEEALRKINRELEEFAYVASHDLQEPLRKVSLYTQLLLELYGDEQNQEVAQYSQYIDAGVQRMQTLIQDLLSYSRTVHYAEELDTPTADLNLSVADALTVLDEKIAEGRARVTVGQLPTVRADQRQMSLVFQNLISNALKYSAEGQASVICIDAVEDEGYWVVSVQDNGIGFGAEYAEKIFGLFKRLYKDEYPGTGLGLAICKRIIERYRGRIWASSQGEGTGSTFYFSLPV